MATKSSGVRPPLVARPGIVFCLALVLLLPVQIYRVATSDSFSALPKPVGDGPDYENIAFHLWQGDGFRFNNSSSQWRRPYQRAIERTQASSSAADELYSVHLAAARRDFLTTSRPPLLPTVIASIYAVTGRNESAFAAVRVFLAACLAMAGALATSSTAVVMRAVVCRAGLELSDQTRQSSVAIACAWGSCLAFCALNQTLSNYATDFLSEPIALVLLQSLVGLLVFALRRPTDSGGALVGRGMSIGTLVLSGVLLGLLILTRSMFVLWLPFLWFLFASLLADDTVERGTPPARRFVGIRSATVVCLIACLCCLPWWARNTWVLGTFQPLGTQGAITLLGGYCDAALQQGGEWQAEPEQSLRAELSKSEALQAASNDSDREQLVSQTAKREVFGWLRAHVLDLPRLFAARVYTHWNPYTGKSLFWKLACLGGLGILFWSVRAATDRRQQRLLRDYALMLGVPLVISTVVVAGLYSVGGRFLVPCYGILFTLSGLGVGGAVYLGSYGLFSAQRN